MVTTHGHDSAGGTANITKARSKVVKPILKKLSYSEKGSLDLDRGWDEQQMDGMWEPIGTGKSAKDVNFNFGTSGARGSSGGRRAVTGKEGLGAGGSSGGMVRKPFQQHGRSHSGASIATNGSGGMRSGSFVHPFQQMPRTATPPLSYANSLASFDNGSGAAARDYSPTITENEDDDDGEPSHSSHLHLTNLNHNHSHHASISSAGHQPTLSKHSSTFSQTGLRRPSLASQRTSSLTDITSALTSTPQLRLSTNTGRSTPSTSRLAPSKSDLHLNLTLSELESPVGSLSGTPTLVSAATAPPATSSTPMSPLSPLRTSLEAMRIPTPKRLRAKSDFDTAVRQENIREARRKFEERERVKEAKYEREEVERRNRQANKEAARIEKETKEWYKATGVSSAGASGIVGASHAIYTAGGGSSHNGSSVNVLHGDSILQAPRACAQVPGRPSASRRTTPTSAATTPASVPTHPLGGGRSVGVGGVFGGKSRMGSFGVTGVSRPDFTGGHASNYNGGSFIRNNSGFGHENQANVADAEKGLPYDSLPRPQDLPRFGQSIDDAEEGVLPGQDWRRQARARRSSSAKKKTQTSWQAFVLWLRTRIFKLRRR